MARGWESKAVAEQIDAKGQRAKRKPTADDDSQVGRLRQNKFESLRMSKSRTVAQLERATTDNHREMLRKALHSLEAEMKKISEA